MKYGLSKETRVYNQSQQPGSWMLGYTVRETLSLTMLFLVDTNAFRQKSHEYG